MQQHHKSFCTFCPLRFAACKGRLPSPYYEKWELLQLFIDNGVDIDHVCLDEWNALMVACRFDRIESAKLLIDMGANVNLGTIHTWTDSFSCEIMQLLIEAGCNVEF